MKTNESNLPLTEARDRLITRIKQDNAEVLQLEKELMNHRKIVDQHRRTVDELEAE